MLKIILKIYNAFLEADGKLLFLFLCLLTFLLLLAKKNFVENEIAAFEILDQEGKMGIFHFINGLQYLAIPVVYLWKFLLITFILWISCFFFGLKTQFMDLWKVVMVSELIFFFPELLKILYFIIINPDPDLSEVRAYYPISLIQLFNVENIPKKWHYPLKAINLFEFLYWGLLVLGIERIVKRKHHSAWTIVLSSYGLFFVGWLGYYVIVYK